MKNTNSTLAEAANVAKRIAQRRVEMNRRREKGIVENYTVWRKPPELKTANQPVGEIAQHYTKKGYEDK